MCVCASLVFCCGGEQAIAGKIGEGCAQPTWPDGQQVTSYQVNQTCPPIPKLDYTDDGRAIMVKRYPFWPTTGFTQAFRYRWAANKKGVEHYSKPCKLFRNANDVLSEEQKAILREWGQPDYLRGQYRTTRNDYVIEWAYLPLNHIFQFVDRTMVYEGPLTDQDRVSITFGQPREIVVGQAEPNIRRETWVYRPLFLYQYTTSREKIFSFSNGRLTYSQETP